MKNWIVAVVVVVVIVAAGAYWYMQAQPEVVDDTQLIEENTEGTGEFVTEPVVEDVILDDATSTTDTEEVTE